MKVLELLDEIEEIVDTSSGFPLTGKILVDAEEILEIVKEIRVELPDEIQQAQWIKDERQRILQEAKQEYETILKDAKVQAEALIENDDITVKAKMRAEEIMRIAESNVKSLKMSTFDYIDSILYNFQDKMDQMNAMYFQDMFNNLQTTFEKINGTIAENRNEIKDMVYKTQIENND
ncbi:MAG: ATPase [Eubacteriales bacterium]|nr:ATPase [Eubacteriales bacterium]MDD3199887.1 ATPase [Eubacteriales bacterium]MDD4630279.1 ATPase [Eubacteriales bacterium]